MSGRSDGFMASPGSQTVFAGVWLHGYFPNGCELVDFLQCGLRLTSNRYAITGDDEDGRYLHSDFMILGCQLLIDGFRFFSCLKFVSSISCCSVIQFSVSWPAFGLALSYMQMLLGNAAAEVTEQLVQHHSQKYYLFPNDCVKGVTSHGHVKRTKHGAKSLCYCKDLNSQQPETFLVVCSIDIYFITFLFPYIEQTYEITLKITFSKFTHIYFTSAI